MRVTAAAQDQALEIRDQLVMQHVPLVRVVAQRLAQRLPSQVEMSDLVSVGVIGLIDAATRYQPALGVPFDAFARRRVRGAMLDSLRELDWAPRSLRRLRRDVDTTIARLRHELGTEPGDAAIAEAMGLSLDAYNKVLEQLRTLDIVAVRPLDAPGDDGARLLDLCVDQSEGVVARLERKELVAELARALQQLPERERQILALSYEQELTLAEIGQVIGVSESRVCQLRSQAIARLRSSLTTTFGLEARR
jgi:RNA polymerase sigma factor for flagellar operon FliA